MLLSSGKVAHNRRINGNQRLKLCGCLLVDSEFEHGDPDVT